MYIVQFTKLVAQSCFSGLARKLTVVVVVGSRACALCRKLSLSFLLVIFDSCGSSCRIVPVSTHRADRLLAAPSSKFLYIPYHCCHGAISSRQHLVILRLSN